MVAEDDGLRTGEAEAGDIASPVLKKEERRKREGVKRQREAERQRKK